ncbi:MAG: peptidoglycan-binding protein LysM [Flavobacteriales bacterium]
MGLLSFLKDAGTKVFGGESAEEKALKIKSHLDGFGLDTSMLDVVVVDEKVTLSGKVKNLEEKQKIIATAGNIDGVSEVEEQLETVAPITFELPDMSKTFYTVKSGDFLSKIAGEVYGDSNAYQKIFEANKPMLEHPDKIYPGQVLYIPQN